MKKMMILLFALSLLVPVTIEPSNKTTQTYISKQVTKAKDFVKKHKKTSFIVAGAMSLLMVGGVVKFALYFSEKKTNTDTLPKPELLKVETQNQEEEIDTIAEEDSFPSAKSTSQEEEIDIIAEEDSESESQEPLEPKKYQEKKEIKIRDTQPISQKKQKKDDGDEVDFYQSDEDEDNPVTIINEGVENKPSKALEQLVMKDELRRLAMDSRSESRPEIEAKNAAMTQEIIDAILKDPENKISPEDVQHVIEIVGGVTQDNPKMAIQISADGLSNGQLEFVLKHVKQLAHKKNLTDSLSIRTSEAGCWQEESLAMKFEGDFPAFKERPQTNTETKNNKKESEIQVINTELSTKLYNFLSDKKINMENTTITTQRDNGQIRVYLHGNQPVFGNSKRKFQTKSVCKYLQQWANQQKKDSIKDVRVFVYNNTGKTYKEDKSLFTVLL